MSGKDIKVTDKRMFTPDGRLREEYRFLEDGASGAPEPTPGDFADGSAESSADPAAESSSETPLETPGEASRLGTPSFLDLVSLLAEPAAVYLSDARLPDGTSSENLDLARLHIDLLDILRQKTAGNLSAQESSFLEELLYRLRVRYVQKRG